MKNIILSEIESSIETKKKVLKIVDRIEEAANLIINTLKEGNKIMVCGNGGSAASANHFVTELVGDFLKEKKRGIFAISLSTNSSLLTALSNDIGYENVFSRELYTIGEEGDILIAISTSGKSENVNRACKTAADKGIKVVYLTGAKNPAVADICDVIIRVPSHSTPRIQEVHDLILHIFAYLIEKEFK